MDFIYNLLMKAIVPLEIKNLANKFIKFHEFSESDSIDDLNKKVIQNQEILIEIFGLNNRTSDNSSLPEQFYNFFEKLKKMNFHFSEISNFL